MHSTPAWTTESADSNLSPKRKKGMREKKIMSNPMSDLLRRKNSHHSKGPIRRKMIRRAFKVVVILACAALAIRQVGGGRAFTGCPIGHYIISKISMLLYCWRKKEVTLSN